MTSVSGTFGMLGTVFSSFVIAFRMSSAAVFDVVRCRGAHVRMAQDALNHHFSDTPRRYRLLPSPRCAACQPCHSANRASRLYS